MSLFVMSVALAQVAPEEPAIVVALTTWVSPADVDAMQFLQDGRALGGRLVYDERALEVVFWADAPIGTHAPVAFDFPVAVTDAVSPYGPFYDPNLPLATAPRCDYGLDRDEDGLPDCAERPGQMYWGHWLYDLGAQIGPKDWFVRVGWMENQQLPTHAVDRPWTRPFPQALEEVEGALLDAGITVHFDVGALYSGPDFDGYDPVYHGRYDLGGGDHGFPFNVSAWSSPAPGCNVDYTCANETYAEAWTDGHAGFIVNYRKHLVPSGDRVFSFVLFANTSKGSASGVAHVAGANAVVSVSGGNDAVFTLDPLPDPNDLNYWRPRTTQEQFNKIVNYQAGTLLHELGHLLGLREGGADTLSTKPNHLSSMSYVYQQTGLPRDGSGVEARYYASRAGSCPDVDGSIIPQGPLGSTANFRIGYSRGDESLLDETALDEALGFTSNDLPPFAIDWDCDGVIEIDVQTDITGPKLVLSNDPDTCAVQPGPQSTDLVVPSNDVDAMELWARRWFGQPFPNDGLPFACPLP